MSARDLSDDDAFALRDAEPDEDPRAGLGYRASPVAPSKPDPDRLEYCAEGRDCKGYKAGAWLIQRPRGGTARNTCIACVGRLNRAHTDRVTGAIRDLKAAVATGRGDDERSAMSELTALAGAHQAGETIAAIRLSLNEKPAQKGYRR